MSARRRASGTGAVATASPNPGRHFSLVEDVEGKIQIGNNLSHDRKISDQGFASMDKLSYNSTEEIHPKHTLGTYNLGVKEDGTSAKEGPGMYLYDKYGTLNLAFVDGPDQLDDNVSMKDINLINQGSSHECQKHTSDYSVVARSDQKHGTDNLGMSGDEASANVGAKMRVGRQGGSIQAKDFDCGHELRPRPKSVISVGNDSGHSSAPSPRVSTYTEDENSEDPPMATSQGGKSVPRIEVGHSSAPSPRVSTYTDDENAGDPPMATSQGGGLMTRIEVGHSPAPSLRVSTYTDDENAGDPPMATSQGGGLVTRIEMGHNPRLFSYSGDSRKGSDASNLTLTGGDSRSGSVDSAIDMMLRPRASLNLQRNSLYEHIMPVVVEERGAEPTSIEKDQELLVDTTDPDNLQQHTPNTAPLDMVENTIDSHRPHPTLRFIRSILRLLIVCIPRSHQATRSVEASYNNPAFSGVAEVVNGSSTNGEKSSSLSSDVRSPHWAPPSSPSPSPSPPASPLASSSTPAKSCCAAFSKKDKFLSSFDRTCSKAKDANLDVVGRVIQIENFAAAMLDSRGGLLSIDALGVHLFIPPGAIIVDSPKRVYIYVQAGNQHNHLTPYVHCGPPKYQFHKDVFLTLPHCAKNALDKQFTFEKCTSEGSETIQGPDDGIVLVGHNSLTLSMDHFCGYGASGNIYEKFMLVCLFVRRSRDANEEDIHVRVFNNTKANLQEVEREENTLGFVLLEKRELVVHKTKQKVVAKLTSKADSWTITHPESSCHEQNIQPQYLWREYSSENVCISPCMLFCARNSSSLASDTCPFEALLEVFQDEQKKAGVEFILRLSMDVKIEESVSKPSPSCGELDALMLRKMNRASGSDTGPWLDQSIREKLTLKLEDGNPVSNWHHLPERLFGDGDRAHGHSWVQEVENRTSKKSKCSPTEYVLDEFIRVSIMNGKGKEETLGELVRGLLEMCKVRQDLEGIVEAIQGRGCGQLRQGGWNNNKQLRDGRKIRNSSDYYSEYEPGDANH